MSGEAILATLHDPKGYENSSAYVDVGRKGLARATNERIGEEGGNFPHDLSGAGRASRVSRLPLRPSVPPTDEERERERCPRQKSTFA